MIPSPLLTHMFVNKTVFGARGGEPGGAGKVKGKGGDWSHSDCMLFCFLVTRK